MLNYLLDKNVVRRTIEGIAQAQRGERVRPDRAACLVLLHAAAQHQFKAFITPQSLHVLEQMVGHPEVQNFLDEVDVIQVSRYARRWARRLREHGFTREDAVVLCLGTFGTDLSGSILGVDAVVTLDLAFINHFYVQHEVLTRRLRAMTQQLTIPFRNALLPELWQVSQALVELSSDHGS